MNEEEALKKFESEVKERDDFIRRVRNKKVRLYKITMGKYYFYSVSFRDKDQEKANARWELKETAKLIKKITGKNAGTANIDVELIKEA